MNLLNNHYREYERQCLRDALRRAIAYICYTLACVLAGFAIGAMCK